MDKANLGASPAFAVRLSTVSHWGGNLASCGAAWFCFLTLKHGGFLGGQHQLGFVYEGRMWEMLSLAAGCWVVSYIAIGRLPTHFRLTVFH